MSLNWKEINLILEELPLINSHIQKIGQPDYSTIVFEHYNRSGRFTLLISLAQNQTRLHRVTKKPQNSISLQRFAQFLRSRIRGGRVLDAKQLGSERIVRFVVRRGGEITRLYCRLWGGAANIIATTEEGRILDAFYRRPKRGEVSGGIYQPEKDFDLTPSSEKEAQYQARDFPGEGSFNEKVESFYSAQEEEEILQFQKARATDYLKREQNRILASLKKLEKREENCNNAERLKEMADLIASNIHTLERGDRWLTTVDFFHDNEEITIELDPHLNPAENAESYYNKYEKAKSGIKAIGKEMQLLKEELQSLKDKEKEISATEDTDYLALFLEKTRKSKQGKTGKSLKSPGHTYRSGDYTLLVGRSSRDNDALLRKYVHGNDYWVHARDYPGAYVFIKNQPGKSVPLETLLDAGNLAIFFSKARGSGGGECFYTQVKYLRRAKHGKTGLVIPTQEKNLSITLEEDRLNRMFRGPEDQEM